MIFVIVTLILLCIAQIFLSTRNNKFWGLLMPGLNIILLIVMLITKAPKTALVSALILTVFLAIYFVCRNRIKKAKISDISRMKINDL